VQEKKWKAGGADAWLMNEVQLDLRQGDHKLLKGVEVPLVILGAPVHDEFSQIGKVGAVSPATTGSSSGKRTRSSLAQTSASVASEMRIVTIQNQFIRHDVPGS